MKKGEMSKKQITEKQLFTILNFINRNYSVVREGGEGLEKIDIEELYKNIWETLDNENDLLEYLLSKEGDMQVESFESAFELNDSMISNIDYQENYFDPENHFKSLNKYAQRRLLNEGKLDKALTNVLKAKKLSIIQIEKERLDKENKAKKGIGYIYLIKSRYGYKIGKSKNIKQRNKLFSIKMPFEFDYVFKKKCSDYHNLEIRLHEMFKDKNINGEWFQLSEDDIKLIKEEVDKYEAKK